jgi:hypothetical protein
MTVEVFTLKGSSDFENAAFGATPVETLIAFGAGVTETTCGGGVVVNAHVTSTARALPAKSVTPALPPFTTPVYVTPGASGAVGSSVAVNEAAS